MNYKELCAPPLEIERIIHVPLRKVEDHYTKRKVGDLQMQEFESCEIYIAILLLGFAANDLKKNTIRDGGSTALYTA